MNWSQALNEIRAKKLELARMDPRGGMPLRPSEGASETSILHVERRIGRPIPPSYRAFLAQHDGFPQLFQATSLLGTSHLARGTYVDLARMVLNDCETPVTNFAPASSVTRRFAELIPFAIDPSGETIVAWDPTRMRADGEFEIVLWINEIGERIDSFPRFLELVLDMLCADVEERRSRLVPRSEPRAAQMKPRPEPLAARVGPRPPMSSLIGLH
jgi:hypothetical protein